MRCSFTGCTWRDTTVDLRHCYCSFLHTMNKSVSIVGAESLNLDVRRPVRGSG